MSQKSKHTVSMTDVYRQAPDVIAVAEESVTRLFAPQSNVLTELFGIGPEVWKRLDGRKSVATLASELERTYEVSEATIRKDLCAFLNKLLARNMCVKVDKTPSR